ncbi:hypothetical protein J4E83_010503 [Alternaria metachromatica]|uniref:uncharacterized protein n=1 Tax=Alternaria metachromatica TaxID=283354 RepID=UPI0020C42344|nr:uncharacterized protein J4E83_010503 [Alternaria metachromatica]KAI4605611.1 hypothetical protein J4E83_010503 [Alternaria metachromatica]
MLLTVPSIKDGGNFRALSYEWGERKKEREVFTESGVLKIWGSLHKAILTLRGKQNAAVFWIDAICINQIDDSEKIQQIRLLPQIFQQASRTIAFLGSDRRSDDAIETLLQIRAKLDKSEEWPKELKKVPESWQHESKPRLEDPIWQDIKVLFDRTWFRRAWIVQEAVASLTVTFVCGKWIVDWEDIHLAMEIVQQKPHLPNDITASWAPFSTLSSLRELETRQRRFSLFTLLDKFHYMQSTLKRDHFFALLGLASDGDEDGFSPRYGSIPFVSIAVQYGETFVKQGKGAHLLRRAGIAGRSDTARTRFPSWLPDLTARPRDRLLDLHDRGIIFNASKGVKEDINTSKGVRGDIFGRDFLEVNGCIFDDIIEVSKTSNGQGPKQWVKYFAEIDDMINALHSESLPEYRHDLKVQVPIAGALSLGELSIEDSYTAFRQSLKKARFKSAKQLNLRTSRAPISKTSSSIQTGVMTMQEKGRQYEELLKTNIAGWRFITTKRKHCGIAPNGVRVGDVISVIGGCDVPFVMRGSRKFMEFRLIAGCYVHGMMKGEASKFPDVNETYFLID